MTGDDLDRIATYILDRWPTAAAWRNADRFADDYLPLRYDRTMATVTALFRTGRAHAPTPSEILAATLTSPDAHEEPGPAPHDRHVWAIVDDDSDDGGRIGMCAITGCHVEKHFPPGRLLTQTEIDDRKTTRPEPR